MKNTLYSRYIEFASDCCGDYQLQTDPSYYCQSEVLDPDNVFGTLPYRGNYKNQFPHRLRRATRVLYRNYNIIRKTEGKVAIEKIGAKFSQNKQFRQNAEYVLIKILKVSSLKNVASGTLLGVLAAYITLPKYGMIISLEMLADQFELKTKLMRDCLNIVSQIIKIGNRFAEARTHVPNLCSQLKLSNEIETLAISLAMTHQKRFIKGQKPRAIAAASVYVSAYHYGVKIKQALLQKMMNISDSTLRKRIGEILTFIDSLFS